MPLPFKLSLKTSRKTARMKNQNKSKGDGRGVLFERSPDRSSSSSASISAVDRVEMKNTLFHRIRYFIE